MLIAVLASAASLPAQVNSNTAAVNLAAIMGSSISVSASPALVNFNLAPGGVANGSSTITVTTQWVLRPLQNVTLYAYFTSAAGALTDGAGHNIPSSKVSGSPNGGAFTSFTGNSPFAVGSSITIFTERVVGNNRNKIRNDTLGLQIDTSGLGLPSGIYTGVLNLRAQAI